ncbi:MAG: heavy metal translocating P-type ATPase [Bdellovibrionales bacterium]|nr:heavy metal translocating P-type ATPase [Bdellovibrionales bacterium]
MSSTASTALQENPAPACEHCGLRVPSSRINCKAEKQFCCGGCEYVYGIINGLGLAQFYSIKQQTGAGTSEPAAPRVSEFAHFADPAFAERYVVNLSDSVAEIKFSLDSIYCAACVWLVEKLPNVLPGVREARVDFGRKNVKIVFDRKRVELPKIAQTLNSFGYCPRPYVPAQRLGAAEAENKQSLLRLGVAGVCAGNSMMIAVSLYQGYFSGMEQKYQSFMQWISLLVSLPVVFYSAVPFYRRALGGLRVRSLHIDLPISLGVVLGFSASFVNTLLGNSHVYYDSICMLVFLLLLGRRLQQRGLDQVMDARSLMYSLSPSAARRVSDGVEEEVYVETLAPGDLVAVDAGEVLPADGTLYEGATSLNLSILTGESQPRKVNVGDEVFAGTTNLGSKIIVQVNAAHDDSRIGRLLAVVEQASSHKSKLTEITDRVGAYFVAAVLLLGAATFVYWTLKSGALTAMDRTLALLIVTCPCALGLAAPLSLSAGIHRAASRGILIKGSDVIERLSRVRTFFFDKTGTLTYGSAQVTSFYFDDALVDEVQVLRIAEILERVSQHPAGRAIRGFAAEKLSGDLDGRSFDSVLEIPGKGVEARSNEIATRIGSSTWLNDSLKRSKLELRDKVQQMLGDGESPVLLEVGDRVVGVFSIGDALREDSPKVLQHLAKKGYCLEILSGDVKEVVAQVANDLDLPLERAHGELSPESKYEIVSAVQRSFPCAMIGDGVNDAAALGAAEVGIGMSSGAEACLRSADVYIAKNGLSALLTLIEGAAQTMAVVRRNIAVSLVYNVLGATGAIMGYVSPLVAAVLMPLSSLSVVLSTVFSRAFTREIQ